MYVKKYLAAFLSICIAASLTACGGSLPDMTEDEYNHTIEYAAGVLMKWSNNGQERLVYVDAAELEKQRKKLEAAKEKEETPPQPPEPQEPPEPVEPEVTEEPEPLDQPDVEVGTDQIIDDTTEIADASDTASTLDTAGAFSSVKTSETDIEKETEKTTEKTTEKKTETETQKADSGSETAATDSNAVVLSSDESREVMDNIFLSYQGYMVSSTYPESSKSYVVNADKGKKLLVLRFDLYNGSDRDKSVNFIPMNLMFQIIMNGKNIGYSSVTFLPNDLASYSGNIESRAHESVVVLTQISSSEATNIQSLGMVVTRNGSTTTYDLR